MIRYLNVPRVFQEDDYSCGPACINMLTNYYNINSKRGNLYSLPYIRRVCNVDKEYGTTLKDMNSALKHFGLKRSRCKDIRAIKKSLDNRYPVLTIAPDVEDKQSAHYIIIRGYRIDDEGNKFLLVADPYYTRYRVDQKKLMDLLAREDKWIWSIKPD